MAMSYEYAIVLTDKERGDVLCVGGDGRLLIFDSPGAARTHMEAYPSTETHLQFRVKRIGVRVNG